MALGRSRLWVGVLYVLLSDSDTSKWKDVSNGRLRCVLPRGVEPSIHCSVRSRRFLCLWVELEWLERHLALCKHLFVHFAYYRLVTMPMAQ